MDQPAPDQDTLVCTRCYADTGCSPDLSHMSHANAIELVTNWKCADCLDEDDRAEASEEPS